MQMCCECNNTSFWAETKDNSPHGYIAYALCTECGTSAIGVLSMVSAEDALSIIRKNGYTIREDIV